MSTPKASLKVDPEKPTVDVDLLQIGLSLTPAQRLEWLERTVEELLPWLGLASRQLGKTK